MNKKIENKYTQKYIATIFGCSQAMVTHILSGKVELRASQIATLLREYDDLDLDTCIEPKALKEYLRERRADVTALIKRGQGKKIQGA